MREPRLAVPYTMTPRQSPDRPRLAPRRRRAKDPERRLCTSPCSASSSSSCTRALASPWRSCAGPPSTPTASAADRDPEATIATSSCSSPTTSSSRSQATSMYPTRQPPWSPRPEPFATDSLLLFDPDVVDLTSKPRPTTSLRSPPHSTTMTTSSCWTSSSNPGYLAATSQAAPSHLWPPLATVGWPQPPFGCCS